MTGKEGLGAANFPILYGPRALPSPWPKGKVASASKMPKRLTNERTLPLGESRGRKPQGSQKRQVTGLEKAICVPETFLYMCYSVVNTPVP